MKQKKLMIKILKNIEKYPHKKKNTTLTVYYHPTINPHRGLDRQSLSILNHHQIFNHLLSVLSLNNQEIIINRSKQG